MTVIEIAPGVDLQRDVLDKSEFELRVDPNLKTMAAELFSPQPQNLILAPLPAHPRLQAVQQ